MLDPMNYLYQDANGTWTRPVTDAMRHQWAINTAESNNVAYSLYGGDIIGGRCTRNYTIQDVVASGVPVSDSHTGATYNMRAELVTRLQVGDRVEIPVHYETWWMGARFGTVYGFRSSSQGWSDCVLVRMDNKHVSKLVKVWKLDWLYMKLLK